MSLRNFLAAALFVLPATMAMAAVPPGVIIDRKVFVPDARVNAQLKLISDSRLFDEAAARTLVQILMAEGLTLNEQDLLYEFVNARTPVTVSITTRTRFDVPPPNGPGRDFLNLFRIVSEADDLEPLLDARWLTGARQSKELVDISTFSPEVASKVVIYLSRKFTASWMNSNAANGFQPLKDDIARFVGQLSQTDSDTGRRGRALALTAVRDTDRRADDAIPDDVYASLRP